MFVSGSPEFSFCSDASNSFVQNSKLTFALSSQDSIAAFYKANDGLDAVICCGGSAFFGPMEKAGREQLQVGWASKAGGQIDLVLQGQKAL